jgi:hypothetical protein
MNEYSDYVMQHKAPLIPTVGIDSESARSEIEALNELLVSDYRKAQDHAKRWFHDVNEKVIKVLAKIRWFQKRLDAYYPQIITFSQDSSDQDTSEEREKKEKRYQNKLEKFREKVQECLGVSEVALLTINSYQGEVDADCKRFDEGYQQQKILLKGLSKSIDDLDEKINRLQAELKATNDQVTKKAIETATGELELGVTLVPDAATGNYQHAITTGATMGIKMIKGEVERILLAEKAYQLVKEIKKQAGKLNKMEFNLQLLKNVGTQLRTLSDIGTQSFSIVTLINNYWQALRDGLDDLIKNVDGRADRLSEEKDNQSRILKQWSTMADTIDKFLSYPLGSVTVWNYDNVEFGDISEQ